jgi:hypothetical protein
MPTVYSANLGILDQIKNDVTFGVRKKIFNLFMEACAPGPEARVADFGVSGHRSHPTHYFFEELYPYRKNLTAIARASEEAGWVVERFPGIQYLEADLRDIPLPDLFFDYGICNAVIEHAGPREQQAALVREVCRVCRCVMFTTPNTRLLVEPHTFLPLLHWLPGRTYRAILRRIGFGHFADVEILNLLGAAEFLALFPPARSNRMLRTGFPLVATNLVCVSSEERPLTRSGSNGQHAAAAMTPSRDYTGAARSAS